MKARPSGECVQSDPFGIDAQAVPRAAQIRVIAICVFSLGSRILLNQGKDPVTRSVFLRPLGGGVEFGETGAQAISREVLEELGAAVRDIRFLGALENLFTFGGRRHHEVVLVYDARFEDHRLYDRTTLEGRETDGQAIRASWHVLDAVTDNLVPAGLHSFLRSRLAHADP